MRCKISRSAFATLVALICALTATARLIPSSGQFQGTYLVNRWGLKLFTNGTSALFVSDDVAKTLAPFAGQPVTLDVKQIEQIENPGAGVILAINKVTPALPDP